MGERFNAEDPGEGSPSGGASARYADGGTLEIETIYGLLADSRRRTMLSVVAETGATTMRDLALGVAARESGIAPGAVNDDRRRKVAVALYHVHVPKFADAEVFVVDDCQDLIRLGPNAEPAVTVLERLRSSPEVAGVSTRADASK